MAKETKNKNKKVVEKEEVVNDSKAIKAELKNQKKEEKLAILKEKQKIEEKIDSLVQEKKATKDKKKKKELNKQIEELKYERSEIGKKPTYLRNVKKEMDMVRWPSAKETFKYTIACLVFVLFFALFFIAIDSLFAFIDSLI